MDNFEEAREKAADQGLDESFMVLEGMTAQAHELFTGYVNAGFSEGQAVYLAAVTITGNPGYPPRG